MTEIEYLQILFKKYESREYLISDLALESNATSSDISILLNRLGFHYSKKQTPKLSMEDAIKNAWKYSDVRNIVSKIIQNM